MKRVLKWLVGLLLTGLVVFVGLILVVPLLFDANDYKGKISDLVYDKSGYRLEIPGKIRLQVTPGLDILFSLGQVRVLSSADFPDTILLTTEEAGLELSLLPLLREKRLEIRGLQLHGVYCHLIRDKAGRGNWEAASPAPAPVETSAPVSKKNSAPEKHMTAAKDTEAKGALPLLDFGSLDMSRITVRYEDQQTGKTFELKEFSMQTGRVQDGLPFQLQSAFVLTSSGSGNSVVAVESTLETEMAFSLAAQTIRFEGLSLVSKIKALGMQEMAFRLAGSCSLDLQQKKANIDSLTLASGDLSLVVRGEVENFAGPVFQGTLQIPEFSLREFLEQNNVGQPTWKDDSALRRIGLSLGFQGDGNTITVSDIQALLDGANAKGRFVLVDPAHPAYEFTMHLDRLDLDRYAALPPETPQARPKNQTSQGPMAKEPKGNTAASTMKNAGGADAGRTTRQADSLQPLFPVELLRGLDFTLQLTVDSMKSSGAELSQVELKARGKDGLLELKPFQAKLYNGTISAETTLDVRGSVPRLEVKKDLDHVSVGPLLRDMTGKEEISGVAVLSAQLTSSGNNREALLRSLNGNMNLALQDGEIKRLRILQVIRQARALYKKEQVVQSSADEPTAFAFVSASGMIKEGIFYNNDLKANSDLMKVTGKGEVDFADEKVDYLLNIYLARGLNRADESGRVEYGKTPVPYRIRGTFSDLKEEADVAGLLKSQAKTLLMNELQKQLDKGDKDEEEGKKKDPAKQLLEQGLKSLFGK